MRITEIIILIVIFSLYSTAQQKSMAVTIDDLPFVRADKDSAAYLTLTDDLLEHLIEYQVPAVGFVNESNLFENNIVQSYRVEALKKWLSSGMELGNHTYSHYSLHKIPLADYMDDIKKGEKISRSLSVKAGKPYRYFRHPFLHTGRSLETRDSLNEFLRIKGYTIVPVTIDNSEWVFALAYDNALKKDDTVSMNMVISEYIPYMIDKIRYYENQSVGLFGYNIRQILLIHANRLNAAAGSKLFKAVRDIGYKFITVEEALTDPAYSSEDTFTGAGGISWLHRWAITKGKKKDFFRGEPLVPQKVLEVSGLESE